jgi:hypothetical protein
MHQALRRRGGLPEAEAIHGGRHHQPHRGVGGGHRQQEADPSVYMCIIRVIFDMSSIGTINKIIRVVNSI